MLPAATVPPEAAPFAWPLRVYIEDTDAGGIVFYANYLRYMERARTEWLRSLGFDLPVLQHVHGGMFVVAGLQMQYRQPARLDDELLVSASLEEAGRSSLHIAQQVRLHRPGSAFEEMPLLTDGSVRLGWVDAGTVRSARIPAIVLEHLRTK